MPKFSLKRMTALRDAELGAASPELAACMRRFIVAPPCILRPWSYGPEIFACWSVLEDPRSRTGIAYCETGFGPKCPWGLVWITDREADLDIGADSAWFLPLTDAFQDSWMAKDCRIQPAGIAPGGPAA